MARQEHYYHMPTAANLPNKKGRFFVMTEERRKEIQRLENRTKQARYRKNSPEKRRNNDLRYYARQLIAAGYTVTDPAAATRRLAV